MLGKGAQLRIQLGIEPVGLLDRGFEVVQDQSLGHAPEVDEGILQAAQEVIGRLTIDRFAVTLARVRQDDAEDVCPPAPAIGNGDGDAAAEVDLGFLTRSAFQAAEGKALALAQMENETPDAVIMTGKTMVADQVLIDALGGETEVQLGHDDGPPGLTQTTALGCLSRTDRQSRLGADDHFGGFCSIFDRLRAGDHFGGFWIGPGLVDVPGHRIAVDA
jgi:hypothetical protein